MIELVLLGFVVALVVLVLFLAILVIRLPAAVVAAVRQVFMPPAPDNAAEARRPAPDADELPDALLDVLIDMNAPPASRVRPAGGSAHFFADSGENPREVCPPPPAARHPVPPSSAPSCTQPSMPVVPPRPTPNPDELGAHDA